MTLDGRHAGVQDDNDRPAVQTRRLALMAELCDTARDLALEAIERGEDPDMLEVFEEALRECLQRENCNKDDLANVWAMLQLGSRAIRRLSLGTDRYDFGPSSDPPTIVRNRQRQPGG
jgi:hypothetical protein